MAHYSVHCENIPDDIPARQWIENLGAGPGDTVRLNKSRRITDKELLDELKRGKSKGLTLGDIRARICSEFGYSDERSLRRRIKRVLQGVN